MEMDETTGFVTNCANYTEQKWKLDTPNFCDQIFNIRYKAMIFLH